MPTFTPVNTADYTGSNDTIPTGFTDIDGYSGYVYTDGTKYHSDYGTLSFARKDGTFSNDQYASSVLSGMLSALNGDQIGVTVRTSTDSVPNHDCYFAYVTDNSPSTVTYGKVINGAVTNFALDSTATTWANNDVLRLYVLGTTVAVQKNGTDVLSTTDASLSTGNPGICAKQGGAGVMRGDDSVFGDVTATTGTAGKGDKLTGSVLLNSPLVR
jgi:hypothetical protein